MSLFRDLLNSTNDDDGLYFKITNNTGDVWKFTIDVTVTTATNTSTTSQTSSSRIGHGIEDPDEPIIPATEYSYQPELQPGETLKIPYSDYHIIEESANKSSSATITVTSPTPTNNYSCYPSNTSNLSLKSQEGTGVYIAWTYTITDLSKNSSLTMVRDLSL
jgi:hypothetical protein